MASESGRRLPRSFYDRPTIEVARDLLGKRIVYRCGGQQLAARIVEVEAYVGQDDPACHAARGMTKRNEVMFGPPGFSYIYLIYGMYYCLNFVTESEGFPAAVLLRGAEPIEGLDVMLANSPESACKAPDQILSGPGKFCRAFGLTVEQSGIDLTGEMLYLEDHDDVVQNVATSGRIGIQQATQRHWRFYDGDSIAVSKPR